MRCRSMSLGEAGGPPPGTAGFLARMSPPPGSRGARRLRPRTGGIAAIVLAVAGCAAPRHVPPPAPPPRPPREVVLPPSAEEGIPSRVERLVADGRADEAESFLRASLEEGMDGPESRAALLVLLGSVLEAQGRTGEAAVVYCTVAGAEGADRVGPAAWDGLARIRGREGDEAGAVRARMRAWALSDDAERVRRRSDLRRAIERLPDRELRILVREMEASPAAPLARQELHAREAGLPGAVDFTVTVLAPFSGKFEEFGEAFFLGALIALEDRDRARSADSTDFPRVQLLSRDTEGDLLAAMRAARAAVLEDGCDALLGPLLSVTSIGAGGVAQSYGVPLVAPTATDPNLSTIGSYVLTLDPSPRELVGPLANLSVTVLGDRRLAVLLARDGISERYEREFREAVESLGGRVVLSLAYEPGEKDFRRLIERIERANVDAVYIPGSAANLESLASQLEFYEFQRRILGHGGWTHPRILDPGNLALEGAIFALPSAEHPGSEFRLRLRDAVWKRGRRELSRFHVRGYVAMTAVLAAFDQGARRPEELAELLARREQWAVRPEGERVHVLTFRDGVLGPAIWAAGFDLVPKLPPDASGDGDASDKSGVPVPGG